MNSNYLNQNSPQQQGSYQQRQQRTQQQQQGGYQQRPQQTQPHQQGGYQQHPQQTQPHQQDGYQQRPQEAQQVKRHGNMQPQKNAPVIKDIVAEKPRFELVSYGAKSAFQCSACETKAGLHTVFLESAKKSDPDNPANKSYAWNVKTLIQVTRNELPIVIGVLLGVIPSCEFNSHGEQKNKWFSIENQGKNYFFKMGEGGKEIKVAPVPIVDAFQMGLIALSQYTENFPNISSETALSTIRIMAKQMVDTGSFPAVKPYAR